MSALLKKLFGMLFAYAEGDPDEPEEVVEDPVDDDDLDAPELDLADDPPAATAPRRTSASEERLAKLEAEVERRGRMVEEERARASRTPQVDPEYQREEERLRSADITDLERWQIQSNRTIRASELRATQALMQAHDLSDRTRFESKIKDDPRREKYTERVEQEIAKDRARGGSASREDVYYWMLGKDIADGKLKPKAKSAPASTVARGKSPAVRSDVNARGARTERDKRFARLENQNI